MSKLDKFFLRAHQAGQKVEEPNTAHLWGIFDRNQVWRDKLAERASHKALNIAPDDMEINTRTQSGMGWKELAVIGGALLGGWWMMNGTPGTEPPAAVTPDTEYDVRFFDQHGELIDVPRKE